MVVSGYNTEWCRHALPHIMRAVVAPCALVALFLGANDAVLPGFRQHVPVSRYRENLSWMIAQVRASQPAARILLLTPPAVYPPDWEAHCREKGRDLDRSVEHTRLYAEACREVYHQYIKEHGGGGERNHLALVDIYAEMEQYAGITSKENNCTTQWQNVRSLLCDGLHFSAQGNQMLYKLVKRTIDKQFPELSVEQLPHYFPWHDQIDLEHPEESVRPY